MRQLRWFGRREKDQFLKPLFRPSGILDYLWDGQLSQIFRYNLQVSSPRRRNPKRAKVIAAHRISNSKLLVEGIGSIVKKSQTVNGIMGRRSLDWSPWDLLIPRNTKCNFSIFWRFNWKLLHQWKCRTATKYVLMDTYLIDFARYATNSVNKCSDAGKHCCLIFDLHGLQTQ